MRFIPRLLTRICKMSGTEGYTKEDYFTAPDDVADSIKAEYSSVSPDEQNFVTAMAGGIKEYVVHTYGEHISKDMKERIETAEKRIVMVDDEGFKTLSEDWKPESDLSPSEGSAYFSKIGNLIIIRDMVEHSKKIWDEGKETFDSLPEDQKSIALPYIRFSLITQTLVHELVHSCQEDTGEFHNKNVFRRMALDECGASYLTDKIMREKYPKGINLEGKNDKDRADTFNYLLGKYGDEVYDVFFSNVPKGVAEKAKYEELQKDIYSEFGTKKLVQLGILDDDKATVYDRMSESW